MSDLIRSLRLFMQLSEQGNFSAIARRENLSHTTIARAIDDLETHFRVRLFNRTTRRLTLTHDGERLIEHAATILDHVDRAEDELAGAIAARGSVRIGLTTALGLHYAERLIFLRDRHPELSVEMIVTDWRDAADEGGFDLWLRIGEADFGDATLLGYLPRVLVAATAYLEARGTPSSVDDLAGHDCLNYGYAAQSLPWSIDGRDLRVTGFLRASSSEAVLRAMRSGLGIGLLPRVQVADDLARGSITQLLPDARIPPIPVAVAHAFHGMRMPERVRAALAFLVEHCPREVR